MSGFGGLNGSYTLHPGQVLSITGHRLVLGQGLPARLLLGQSGEQVERTLAALFTLCSHAHRRAARMALNAARLPDQTALPEPSDQWRTLETARDHLRSMALDWPRQLALLSQSSHKTQAPNLPLAEDSIALHAIDSGLLNWLKACPLPMIQPAQALTEAQTQEAQMALRTWLKEHVLLEPLEDWLAQHRAPEALAHWCQSRAADLAQDIATQAGFAQFPTWKGQCRETGPWTRLRHRESATNAQGNAAPSIWTRLSSRWMELMELVFLATQRTGNAALASGALNLAPGQAIAWVEMARGLLLHWVQLDEHGKVADYRVIAPTEWNFHPDGALARAVSALPPDDTASAWVLAAAYDACVECRVAVSST